MKINLGAGSRPEDGFTNVDAEALPGVNVVHDLDVFPWPFDDGCAETVKAYDVFEHIADPLGFMAECHRILEPGGRLLIHTCHWQSRNSYTDPTHKRASTEETFDYWIPGTYLNKRYGAGYAKGRHFAKVRLYLDGGDIAVTLRKL